MAKRRRKRRPKWWQSVAAAWFKTRDLCYVALIALILVHATLQTIQLEHLQANMENNHKALGELYDQNQMDHRLFLTILAEIYDRCVSTPRSKEACF